MFLFFFPQKVEKPPSQVAQNNSYLLFFSLMPELQKRPKQKNSCSKMWPIEQLYIELGLEPNNVELTKNKIFKS